MKLSQLVHYRNLLRSYTPGDMAPVINEHAGHALHLVQNQTIQFPSLAAKLEANFGNIHQAFSSFSATIEEIQSEIQTLINDIEPGYFTESYRLYEQFLSKDKADYVLNRQFSLDPSIIDYLHGRIRHYGDWHYSGMIIRPGKEDWIEDLVGCDPLYLIDKDPALFEPAKQRFNEQYQNRLRTYIMRDPDVGDILGQIPDGQFGFCLAYNFFNFKPFEIMRAYLEEIFAKMRPGGTVAFTFNNCDRTGGVELVERHFMCYTPGHLVLTLCESIGFEIAHTYQLDAACTWVEIKKPGKLTSLRGGQSLARVVAKSK